MIIVSSTEPPRVRELLRRAVKHAFGWDANDIVCNQMPESKGVDFLWRGAENWWGVQRKTADDFCSSMRDDRLVREVGQMLAGIALPMILIEGRLDHWAGKITPVAFEKALLSIQAQGVNVRSVRDSTELCEYLITFYEWSQDGEHSTGLVRPKPAGDWGKVTNGHWQSHVLQSLPGVGPKLAGQIAHMFGSPLKLTVSRQELEMVPGIGPKIAARIWEVFGGEEVLDEEIS